MSCEDLPNLLYRLRELRAIIGGTPIVKIYRLNKSVGIDADIYVKLEYMNPTGSHKDRIVVYMLEKAIERGELTKPCVVEASSGNTAISLAWVASRLGLEAYIVVEKEVSREKLHVIRSLGAHVILTDSRQVLEVAREVAKRNEAYFLYQYGNMDNHEAHYRWTGPEIFEQMRGAVDAFVMGMGTCGTVTGVGRYLKERLGGKVKVVGVVPKGSAILGEGGGCDRIEGLACTIKPELCEKLAGEYVDEIIEVSYAEALSMSMKLARLEGVLGGISTGANLVAALKVARELGKGAKIVTIAADSMFRYLSILRAAES